MSDHVKLSKADFPLPMLANDTVWEEWEQQFLTHIGLHGLKKYYVHENPESFEPRWLPAAETAAGMMVNVRDVPENRALIQGLRHNTAENSISTDMIQRWAREVRKNRKAIDVFDAEAASWDEIRRCLLAANSDA